MKKLILIIFLLIPAYIIAQTTYYVSNSEGNDSNTGKSTGQAWKTLTKANSFKPVSGDKILFKRGDAWEGAITPPASGTAGKPIVYGAYGTGDKPKIYGSKVITGWTLHKGNIYKATVSENVSQVFVDNVRIRAARFPDSGYAFPSSVSSTTQFQSDQLDPSINYTGATCIYRSYGYRFYNKKVTASVSNMITLESATSGGIAVSKGFILVNKLAFLTQPGEWFYDNATKTLYVWTPEGGSPENLVVRASTVDYGSYMWSKSYVTIKDMQFDHFAKYGIYGDNNNNITVDNCDISYPEAYGIRVAGGSQSYYTITNNRITGANGEGINIYAPNSLIEGNEVADIALFENLGISGSDVSTGIRFKGDNTTCKYNKVINIGYNGISWRGQNADISYNFIDGACVVLDDGGGIYTWSDNYSAAGSAGSVVHGNIILNVIGNRVGFRSKADFGYGIYIDQRIHDVKVTNNTIHRVSGGILLNAEHGLNLVDGNTVMNFAMGIQVEPDKALSKVTNNIFFTTNNNCDYTWWKDKPQRIFRLTKSNPYVNNNRYFSHYNSTELFDCNSDGYFETFDNWQKASGQDANSICVTSPLASGEKEELFYNDTKEKKVLNLGTTVYRDLDGNQVTEKLSLEPFTSKILIKTTLKTSASTNQSPVVQNQQFNILGNLQAGALIGQIIASDPDNGQVLSYSVIAGNGEDLFSVDPSTGKFYAKTSVSTTIDLVKTFTVQVTDNDTNNPLSASAQITVNIKAVQQNQAPIILDQQIDSEGDLEINKYIGKVVAYDPDLGQTLSYAITQGNEEGLFMLDPNNGQLYVKKALSVTTNKLIGLIVKVTDNGSYPLSTYAKVTVNLIPIFVNQSPVIEDQTFTVQEGTKTNSFIGQVVASDPDLGQALNYAILQGNEGGLFSMDPMNGKIYTNATVQAISGTSIILLVKVTDDAIEPLSASAYITIDIIASGKPVKGEVNGKSPKKMVLYFSESLEEQSSPSPSDFRVNNGKSVLQVSISDDEVHLELSSEYQPEDEIHVSYNGSGSLRNLSGNRVDSFAEYPVDNNLDQLTTNILTETQTLDVLVYPNPTSGIINISADNLSSEDCEIALYSMTGNLVVKKQLSVSFGNLEERIDMSHLARGTYIVQLVSEKEIHKSKIIIM